MYLCLSRPLADSEKLPVRSHRAAEALKSPTEDGDAENATPQEPKKKTSKEKREKKKDKERDRKVRLRWFTFCLIHVINSFSLSTTKSCSRCHDVWWKAVIFLQKSKEEKKKKKHKHEQEEKEEDLLGAPADEPVVQSEETSEVAAPPTSTSAEVCLTKRVEQFFYLATEFSSKAWSNPDFCRNVCYLVKNIWDLGILLST